MARGGDDFYGMPMVALRQWFVLAAEYDLLAVPVINERGVLACLDIVLVQGGQWVSERFTRAQLLQNNPGNAIEYCCSKLGDELERSIPVWRDESGNAREYDSRAGFPKVSSSWDASRPGARIRIHYDRDV